MHNGEHKKRLPRYEHYIFPDSPAAMKMHNNFQIISKLGWECCQSLVKLEERTRIQLMSLPGHMGIDENEIADS
jgi:hypothetical protein